MAEMKNAGRQRSLAWSLVSPHPTDMRGRTGGQAGSACWWHARPWRVALGPAVVVSRVLLCGWLYLSSWSCCSAALLLLALFPLHFWLFIELELNSKFSMFLFTLVSQGQGDVRCAAVAGCVVRGVTTPLPPRPPTATSLLYLCTVGLSLGPLVVAVWWFWWWCVLCVCAYVALLECNRPCNRRPSRAHWMMRPPDSVLRTSCFMGSGRSRSAKSGSRWQVRAAH